MSRIYSFLFVLTLGVLFAVVLGSACSSECSRSGDCLSGEVCYGGVCTPNSAEFIDCNADLDCGGDAGLFTCVAGRCQIKPTMVINPNDGGPGSDSGSGDATPANG